MKLERELALKNLKRKPIRTAALILLTAFLAFSVFGGGMIVMSLQSGLKSYQSRLGADIVVVPAAARSKASLESILLQGIPGYFYMDRSYIDKVRAIDGVDRVSPQFFLASASAGCCSVPVQLIGFDPETDFSIQPWIRESYSGGIGDGDVIVGGRIAVPTNYQLKFYNTECRVVAQLDETGTGLDSAVYANQNTIRMMMEKAQALGFQNFKDINANQVISSLMIKVKDGYNIEDVTNDINLHVRRIRATPAKSMISGIAGGLANVSQMIGGLVAVIWLLAMVILIVTFAMIANERTKEFAVLRMIGATQRFLFWLLTLESMLIGLSGAAVGTALAALVVFPFSGLIRSRLSLPYLLPDGGKVLLLLMAAIVFSVLAGWLAAFFSAGKILRQEPGLVLRDSV